MPQEAPLEKGKKTKKKKKREIPLLCFFSRKNWIKWSQLFPRLWKTILSPDALLYSVIQTLLVDCYYLEANKINAEAFLGFHRFFAMLDKVKVYNPGTIVSCLLYLVCHYLSKRMKK